MCLKITYKLQIIHRIGTETTHNLLHMICAFVILAALVFLTGGLEHSKSDLAFIQPRLRNNVIWDKYPSLVFKNILIA